MKTLTRFTMILLVLLIVAGVGFLATWDIPAPTSTVEKVIPNDRFPK